MIDDKTIKKLLKEVEKSGNVYLSCLRVGVDKATYYRRKKADKEFKKMANQAEKFGRENNCDVAEHALMLKVKDKDMRAIEYLLKHNHPRYKSKKTSSVVIWHKKGDGLPPMSQKSLEDLLDENADEKIRAKQEQKEKEAKENNINSPTDTAHEVSEKDKPTEAPPQS
ncbi:hypothetical protein L6278_00860 [Candidatus Parcubacteria bacterium]|nr:hypothetical protein [Candidatus Parcubacteria bacterium]